MAQSAWLCWTTLQTRKFWRSSHSFLSSWRHVYSDRLECLHLGEGPSQIHGFLPRHLFGTVLRLSDNTLDGFLAWVLAASESAACSAILDLAMWEWPTTFFKILAAKTFLLTNQCLQAHSILLSILFLASLLSWPTPGGAWPRPRQQQKAQRTSMWHTSLSEPRPYLALS